MAENEPRTLSGAAVILIDPKTPYNVGAAIRACSIFGVGVLRWTGIRIHRAMAQNGAGSSLKKRSRLPREERMKDFAWVDWRQSSSKTLVSSFSEQGYIPVCVEVDDTAEFLDEFVHPKKAVYVFGPEDGGVPKGVRTVCHRFVRIRTVSRTPLNLAAAVNVVLYDRLVKETKG